MEAASENAMRRRAESAEEEKRTPGSSRERDRTKPRAARIYRMVMPEHTCPFGLKSVDLLERKGYRVEDHWLTSRAEQDAFKAEHDVETTPQTFIDDRRIGGWDDLRRFFGQEVTPPDARSYRPVLVVFAVSAAIAVALTSATGGAAWLVAPRFLALTMCILALLKLQDVERFSTMFLGYDLLARRVVRYAYVYPYAELVAGLLMLAGALPWVSVPIAAFIGCVGALSVVKAVYVDRRELECACVGGTSRVPLGFVSLTENLVMIGMAIWTASGAMTLSRG